MKGFFIFGRPKRRRLAMTFGYECRPSFWRSVRTNSHLVIAALGTASFMGVAGLALWLAMPSEERTAFDEPSNEPVVTEPVVDVVGSAPQPATPQAAQRGDEVTPETAAAEAAIPALKSNDIRWKDPNQPGQGTTAPSAQTSRQAVDAEAQAASAPDDIEPMEEGDTSSLAAFAAANRAQVGGNSGPAAAKPDSAETAAIPTARPKTEPAKDTAETANGHTVHAVTMRSGPKKAAAAMTTVPAQAAVQVLSCNHWCEIVYNGKRGWIYKSFLKRD